MPQVTVYIREEDLKLWKAIEKKSLFLHMALRGNNIQKVNLAIKERQEIDKVLKPFTKAMKETQDVSEIKKSIADGIEAAGMKGSIGPITITPARLHGVCKLDGTPLDYRGRCMQKGCKNA